MWRPNARRHIQPRSILVVVVVGFAVQAALAQVQTPSDGFAAAGFIGPSICSSDGTTVGYQNTTTLFYDTLITATDVAEGRVAPDEEYNFVLCPFTDYDFGIALEADQNNAQNMVGLIPLLDNSNYLCGKDGELSNKCNFKGGWYHVLFEDDIPLNNVTFYGLTFERSLDVSAMAYGQPNNDAVFINCMWKNNKAGSILVDIYWHLYLQGGIIEPGARRTFAFGEEADAENTSSDNNADDVTSTSFDIGPLLARRSVEHRRDRNDERRVQRMGGNYPSMYLGFAGCSFENNELAVALISNDGGFVDLTKCSFQFNKAAVVLAQVQSAKLAIYGGTTFISNDDVIGPVFLDSSSTLLFHEKTNGRDNIGSSNVVKCEGIFMETPGYDCLNDPAICDGTCCEWGDASCDAVDEEITGPTRPILENSTPSRGPLQPEPTSGGGGCDSSCVAFAIILPIVGLTCVASAVIYLRRRQNITNDNENASQQPSFDYA